MNELQLQYRSSLNDLTFNSKPLINILTTIAAENLENSTDIAKAIEDQLFNVHPSLKIPLIYLMDSILKNVGKSYIPAFQKNILRFFPAAHASVQDEDKARLKRLLHTWRTNPGGYLFPSSVLSALEAAIGSSSSSDQSRPSQHRLPQPAPPASFNQNRIPQHHQPQQQQHTTHHHSAPVNLPAPTAHSILQQLTALIYQNEASLQMQPTNPGMLQQVAVLKQLAQVVSTTILDTATLLQIQIQINSMPKPALHMPGPIIGLPHLTSSGPIGLSSSSFIPSSSRPSFLGISGNMGSSEIGGRPVISKMSSPKMNKQQNQRVPVLRLTSSDIAKVIPGLHFHLYEGVELQCKQCALRFATLNGVEGKVQLEAHMDWHFRQKRRQKDKNKKATSRDWYVPDVEWIVEQPIEPAIDQQGAATVFFGDEVAATPQSPVSNIPAGGTVARCAVCNEVLEKYFDDDQDAWMLKGAINVDGKIYHQACYQDQNVPAEEPAGKKRKI